MGEKFLKSNCWDRDISVLQKSIAGRDEYLRNYPWTVLEIPWCEEDLQGSTSTVIPKLFGNPKRWFRLKFWYLHVLVLLMISNKLVCCISIKIITLSQLTVYVK